ncbi:MAG: nucleotidyl transferase AbiEii/AbiGii toxin family protein [Terrimicrobiaceae bacterium]
MDRAYIETARLMLLVAPQVFRAPDFAMKGGTALNIFLHDMPRLSVDIDVAFTNHTASRGEALQTIRRELQALCERLETLGVKGTPVGTEDSEDVKILVSRGTVNAKIEVNYNFRGTLIPPRAVRITESARRVFAADFSIPALAKEELYGGKLVAALDRQHPRDFFDVREMFFGGHFDPGVVDCFVCYLAGHNRTVHDVLFSTDKNFSAIYEEQFVGMTARPVSIAELEQARADLRAALDRHLQDRHKQFLLGLVRLEPEWDLMPFAHLRELPALKWKLLNLEQLRHRNPKRFKLQSTELARRFGGS